jgi:RimJ/RimL family protein N-acetyltransferase
LENGQLDVAIEADGLLVGEIGTYRPPTRTLPPTWFEIGVGLFDKASRGQGFGTEALSLLVGWLFREGGATRVQAATSPENVAMGRVLDKLGFSPERTLKEGDAEFVLYAISRGRWRPSR